MVTCEKPPGENLAQVLDWGLFTGGLMFGGFSPRTVKKQRKLFTKYSNNFARNGDSISVLLGSKLERCRSLIHKPDANFLRLPLTLLNEIHRNIIKSTRNQIVFTIFRLIWYQTYVRLVPNQSENGPDANSRLLLTPLGVIH